MNYLDELKPYEFKNIYTSLDRKSGPIAVRFDINSPVGKNGRISLKNGDVNLRLEEYGYLLRAYSKLGPLLLMAHQGRKNPPNKKPDKDFVNLLDHHHIISDVSGVRIHFVEYSEGESWEEYSKNVEKHLRTLKTEEAVLMDNVRIWDFEKKFDPGACPYIPLCEDIGLAAFINDGIPLWHRDNASLMFGRHVAPTFIGHISAKELRIQHKILHDDAKKVMVIGGKKPKFEAIPNLVEKMDILTGGVTGILTAQLHGFDVGPLNEKLLRESFDGMESLIKEYEADNGIKLIENILGTGFVAIGGDTVEELQKYELCKPIMYSDGVVLLGGGSHLEGFAGLPYPSIQDLVENGCVKW